MIPIYNERATLMRVNDRGPDDFTNILEVTPAGAKALGFTVDPSKGGISFRVVSAQPQGAVIELSPKSDCADAFSWHSFMKPTLRSVQVLVISPSSAPVV